MCFLVVWFVRVCVGACCLIVSLCFVRGLCVMLYGLCVLYGVNACVAWVNVLCL